MIRTRLLFVDDEMHVLDGLRNLLRRQRAVWDMTFVSSGDEALRRLAERPFDVIVSDMRMPGMDGATLLGHVQRDYPAVVRIVLSGHADQDAVRRVMAVAHQFLSKPCNVETLKGVLTRTSALQEHLNHGPVRDLVGRLDALPSLPDAYRELTGALAQADVSPTEVAAVVERDSAMAVKVLQLVNSPYFGAPHAITSIREAVDTLGTGLLRGLALGAHVFTTMAADHPLAEEATRMQDHAQITARLARRVIPDQTRAEEAFTAGMVHDVGRVVMVLSRPDDFAAVRDESRSRGVPADVVEERIFGATHAAVGAYLLGTWGLPLAVVEAVSCHQAPRRLREGNLDVLMALHVADRLAEAIAEGTLDRGDVPGLDREFLDRAGYLSRLDDWCALAAGESGSGAEPAPAGAGGRRDDA